MRSPTIRDVAQYAGVGVGTVSRVINGSEQVREETRIKVLEAINALNFSPNTAARSLSGGKNWTVGVFSPMITKPSFVERLSGIQDALDDSGYDLVLYSIRDSEQLEQRLVEIVTSKRVDGLVVLTLPFDEGEIALRNPNLPIVVVSESAVDRFPHIMVDNVAGGALATQYLINRDHTLLGFIGDELVSSLGVNPTEQRFQGFQNALEAEGIPLVEEWCRFGTFSEQSAFNLAYQMLIPIDRPTAIFASNDIMAVGVMSAARALGLRIPQDLAIIGFDDLPIASMMNLTTVHQPLFLSGQMAALNLRHWLHHGSLPDDNFQTVLPLEVIQRESV